MGMQTPVYAKMAMSIELLTWVEVYRIKTQGALFSSQEYRFDACGG
jgi:hypothetical protein